MNPTSLTFASGARETATVTLQEASSCRYAVTESLTWLSHRGSSPVAGNAMVTFRTETANTGTSPRLGEVSIGSTRVPVTQNPACPASPRVNPTSLTFASGARETATVTLQEASSCRYAVTESLTWLSHRGSSPVAGNAMVTFRTETANTGTSPRLGEVSIGSTRVPVTQNPACPASPRVNPTSLTFASGARETATVTLQEASSCRYAVTESLTWLSHRGSSPVAGNAMVTFRTETANTGTSPRLGEVSIGTTRVLVLQNLPCPASPRVNPTSLTFASGARETATVTLQEASSCSYTVTENLVWLRVNPSPVAGDGMAMFTTDSENTTGAVLTGTVTIGRTSVSVSQESGTQNPLCPEPPAGLAPRSLHFTASSGTQNVAVMGQSGCSWEVSDSRSWITVRRSFVVSGDSLTVSTAQNTGLARGGTVYVGGTGIAVTQEDGQASTGPTPTADAGGALTMQVGAEADLDGTASRASDGGTDLSYEWEQLDGWTALLLDRGRDEPCFYPCRLQTPYFIAPSPVFDSPVIFRLTVSDANGSHSDTVVATVLGYEFTRLRETLIEKWNTYRGVIGGDLCNTYRNQPDTAKDVFIWNTHRLHRSGILSDVDGLYAFIGKGPPTFMAPSGCGGEEYNRTFMSMKPTLMQKFLQLHRNGSSAELPAWKISDDRAGPHEPYFLSLETLDGGPRGQIHFFDPDVKRVDREYMNIHGQKCYGSSLLVHKDEVCEGTCDIPEDYQIPEQHARCNVVQYQDLVDMDPEVEFTRGPHDEYRIMDAYSFEMDQDYNWYGRPLWGIHDSAPSCNQMKGTYNLNYGSPNWQWTPRSCGGIFILFEPLQVGAIRESHTRELRARIDDLRTHQGLTAFSWTDPTIVPGVTPVKAVHLSELRATLKETYVAAGRVAPEFTDPVIVPRITAIRTVHITELQKAVRVLEN